MPRKKAVRTLIATERPLLDWVRTLPPRTVVTNAMGHPRECLVARFLQAQGHEDVSVGYSGVFNFKRSHDEKMGPRLRRLIDPLFQPPYKVTASRVLKSAERDLD